MTDIFVYGTLTNPRVVKRVTGKTFRQVSAILENYTKIMPGTGYSYIVPKQGVIVKGFVLCDIDDKSLKKIDRFEAVGELYDRVEIDVLVNGHKRRTHTYVANISGMHDFFGSNRVDDEVKIEEHLERKLEFIMGDVSDDVESEIQKQAECELLGDTVELLIDAHFDYSPDLKYKIEGTLSSPDLPTLEKVKSDPEALQYADAYIKLAVKHIVFNQLEKKIRNSYRQVTKMAENFHQHTISNLIALAYINQNADSLDSMLEWLGADKLSKDRDYIDYSVYGILATELLYKKDKIDPIVDWIFANCQAGSVPLGAEIEMSNIGDKAISAKPDQDEVYDCLYYFNDFDLLRRCWKLGCHVDHHRFQNLKQTGRQRGFFEYAFGRVCCLEGNWSKPVTNDPWILAQLINHAIEFIGIDPYSLHITLQLHDFELEKPSDPEYLICLLMLGGDFGVPSETLFSSLKPKRDDWVTGDENIELELPVERPARSSSSSDKLGLRQKLVERRIANGEIIDLYGGLHFICENMHSSKFSSSDDSNEIGENQGTLVTEYKFARLKKDHDYQPLIMAFKGFQIAYRPRPLISRIRFIDQEKLPEVKALIDWGNSPYPLSKSILTEFLSFVERGLRTEKDGKPVHKNSYINDCLSRIEDDLNKKNDLIRDLRKT